MLIHFGVTPYLVFDGDFLPSKAATEKERAQRRSQCRNAGLELHRVGKTSQAQKELQKAVDVTPEMAAQLIRELKKLDVQYVVAPYEADAQLAYLEKKGIIQGVISEDSDLLVFGVKCLLTKLDQYGDCVELNRKDFTACRDISLVGWSDIEFRLMAILSGCDYLSSISNMGLLTAYRMVRKYKTIDKILRMLQFDGKYYVPAGYQQAFENAVLTFRHQRVFCPITKALTTVTEPDIGQEVDGLSFIGAFVEPEIAAEVASGFLHPTSKKPLNVPGTPLDKLGRPMSSLSKSNAVKFEDLKDHKSIKSFFKSKRTPLAELDPNSFQLSRSQEQLQRRASGGWLSSPAPRGPPPTGSSSQEQLSTTPASGGNGLRHSSSSASHQPLKKRRLCSEASVEPDAASPLASVGEGQSRFFTTRTTQPALPRRTMEKRNIRSATINIWSDDSIEDVMADLPDVADSSKDIVRSRVSVLENGKVQAKAPLRNFDSGGENPDTPPADSADQEDSQLSISSIATDLSLASTNTVATSIDGFSQTDFGCVDRYVRGELISLQEKFSCSLKPKISAPRNTHTLDLKSGDDHQVADSSINPNATPAPPTANNLKIKPGEDQRVLQAHAKPESANSLRDAGNLKVKPGEYQHALLASSKPALQRARSMTPLQRLGASALHRSQSFTGPARSNESKAADTAAMDSFTNTRIRLGQRPTETPAVMPLIQALPLSKGSEDLIIPDSEDESCGYSSASDGETVQKSKLDLGKFAFSG